MRDGAVVTEKMEHASCVLAFGEDDNERLHERRCKQARRCLGRKVGGRWVRARLVRLLRWRKREEGWARKERGAQGGGEGFIKEKEEG
jgi:hypothetical protein